MDASGNIVAKYEYSPFGKIVAQSGSYAETNPFRFSSEYHDDETALVYYNYRYYNTTLGRWLSRDPIEEEGGYNLYGMVDNNPIVFWDENGNHPAIAIPVIIWVIVYCTGCGKEQGKKAIEKATKVDKANETLNDPNATIREKSDTQHDAIKEGARNKTEERYVDTSKAIIGNLMEKAEGGVSKRNNAVRELSDLNKP